MLTQAELKSYLHYNEQTGFFTRIKSGRGFKLNSIAGSLRKDGYIYIRIRSERYLAHRLAWLYVYGYFPHEYIDHADGIRNNNSLSNLRECNRRQNNTNIKIRKDNTSGATGVSFNKICGLWHAYGSVNGKNDTIGYFVDLNDAIESRNNYVRLNYGNFIRK